jgi:membrane-bound lytic murein transglycosylase F
MALTRKHGGNPQRWRDVATYILLLSDPAYYRDPVVRYGYLRGSETEAYVRLIMERWQQYRGSARSAGASSVPAPSKKSLRDGAFRSRVKSRDEWTSTMENDTTR